MAVVRDAHGTSQGAAAVSSFTFTTLTIGGSGNALVVGLGMQLPLANTGTLTVTWAGTTMNLLGAGVDIPGNGALYLLGLLNPTTGAQTLSVSWTGNSQAYAVQAVSFSGAGSFGNFNSASGNSTGGSNLLAITCGANDFAIDCACNVVQTLNSPQQTVEGTIFSGNITGLAMTDAAGPGPVNFGYTMGLSSGWADAGIAVQAPAAASLVNSPASKRIIPYWSEW